MNPVNWFAISSAKDAERYMLGSPRDPAPLNLWGVPVVLAPAMTVGAALVIDVDQVALLDRMAPTVLASRDDGDNFTRNLITILGELRAGLAVFAAGAVLRVSLA